MKSQNLSYMELLISKDESQTAYVKWIREHVSDTSSSQLKDLAKFIELFNSVIPVASLSVACFPDSLAVRQYQEL